MSQGKAFTTEEREEIIQSLKPHLEMGLSRNSACVSIGLPPGTLSNWVTDNEALAIRIQSYEAILGNKALSNIRKAIDKEGELDDTRKENSWKYAERKIPEFKPKQDITTNDESINAEQKEASQTAINEYLADHKKRESDG